MFGKNYTLEIKFDKESIIAAIAFVGASCACWIMSHGLMMFIRGHKDYKWARIKGFIMFVSGACLLAGNLAAILRSDIVVKKMSDYLTYIAW
jgi:hypothetical protein